VPLEPWCNISARTATPTELDVFFESIEKKLRESSGLGEEPVLPVASSPQSVDGGRLNLEQAIDALQTSFIRSGDVLSLDRIADLPAEERLMYVALIASQAGSADECIARALIKTGVIDVLRQETIQRTSRRQP